jgi:hypothetical protein
MGKMNNGYFVELTEDDMKSVSVRIPVEKTAFRILENGDVEEILVNVKAEFTYQNTSRHKTLMDIMKVLIEGKDNTREFLSMARQHLDMEVPTYEDLVKLYVAEFLSKILGV